jgi:hypothetical protein
LWDARACGRGRGSGQRTRRRRRAYRPTRAERSSAITILVKLDLLLHGPSVAARDVANEAIAPMGRSRSSPTPHRTCAPATRTITSIPLLGTSPHLVQDESEVEDAPDLAPVPYRATAVGVVCAPHSLHAGVAGRCRMSLRAAADGDAGADAGAGGGWSCAFYDLILDGVHSRPNGCAAPAPRAACMLTVCAVGVIGVNGGPVLHHGRDAYAPPVSERRATPFE